MTVRKPLIALVVGSFHQSYCLHLTSSFWSKLYGQYSSDDISSQGHLANVIELQIKRVRYL